MENVITNTLLERPVGFTVGKRHFDLYPTTLGRSYLTAPLVKQLGIDGGILSFNPHLELIRVIGQSGDICYRLVALATLKGKQVLDEKKVLERIKYFKKHLTIEELALLTEQSITGSNVEAVIKHFKIDEELERMRRAQQAQDSSSSLSFGGKSIYGSLISSLAEKYGWTLDYILWGISYDNIQLLMADSIKTIYLSEEERNKAGLYNMSKVLDGNDPTAYERLKDMDWFKRACKSGDIKINPQKK